jgi:hypothetical protein
MPSGKPSEISADAGYCSEDNLLALATRKIHAYVATGRAKHPAETTRKVGGETTQKMRQKLKRAGYRSRYRLRKQIVEPLFGQIKQARGFRQFLLHGLEAEWALIRQGDLSAPISNPHAVQNAIWMGSSFHSWGGPGSLLKFPTSFISADRERRHSSSARGRGSTSTPAHHEASSPYRCNS